MLNEDTLSVKSELLNEQELIEKRRNEKKGMLIGILSQLFWALNGIQLKSYSTLFPKEYSLNSLIFWRSLAIMLLGYLSCLKKGIKITPHSEIRYKFWFLWRTLGNYFCLIFWVILLFFFRVSTAQCIANCNPIFLIFMSIILLHETFYIRYLIGILLCILGTWIIVLNDKKEKEEQKGNEPNGNIILGIIMSLIYLLILVFILFGQKILCKENMPGEVQSYYVGLYNALPALIFMIIEWHSGITNILYILYTASNGIIFYTGNYLAVWANNNMSLIKYLPISYTCIVFTYILGFIILGESVYFSDILGSLLILGFHLYNAYFPVGKQS